MRFDLKSTYLPSGDQPEAIKKLVHDIEYQDHLVLMGATGTGKTFTIANAIQHINKPTLVISHNKTLASQLYQEFKDFFPNNRVEFFISYYDYYQPEAYISSTGAYIEKEMSINKEIEKFRLSATSTLLSGRNDIIVICSVSCIYGLGNPNTFNKQSLTIKKGQIIEQHIFIKSLIRILYTRQDNNPDIGNFSINGEIISVHPPYEDFGVRFNFWDNMIEDIMIFDKNTGKTIEKCHSYKIYPCSVFSTPKEKIEEILRLIEKELNEQVLFFLNENKIIEAERIKHRVTNDINMIKELGYCNGIENYSRYFDERVANTRPFCLLDYFPNDYITVIDESHVSLPQIKAMYNGDYARKKSLIDNGFRLPSAFDNRPLKFEEFEELLNKVIFLSATPSDYEFKLSQGLFIDQVIRPTGITDPKIHIKSSTNQIEDIKKEIKLRIDKNEKVLITTLTKRMAEDLNKYLNNYYNCTYIHSEIDTNERIHIINMLKNGQIDVLIGINLLREGLDLPQVSLVCILDSDKEGFLRSYRSLIQIMGRAARHINGTVILYADKITKAMKEAIDETNRRRQKQEYYNLKHNIKPTPIVPPPPLPTEK